MATAEKAARNEQRLVGGHMPNEGCGIGMSLVRLAGHTSTDAQAMSTEPLVTGRRSHQPFPGPRGPLTKQLRILQEVME